MPSEMKVFLVLACLGVALASDTCAPNVDCQSCIDDKCGWCSHKVMYSDGSFGKQCVGSSSPQGYICNGLFSTVTCKHGFSCNKTADKCYDVGTTGGDSLNVCEQTCGAPTNPSPTPLPSDVTPSPPASVFLCNSTSTKCYKVPPGTAGATGLPLCMSKCSHPTTASPHPVTPKPKPKVYSCQVSNWTCIVVPDGTSGSSSLDICTSHCPLYTCNKAKLTCDKVAKGGTSLGNCEAECVPAPTPPATPHFDQKYYCDKVLVSCVNGLNGTSLNDCLPTCQPTSKWSCNQTSQACFKDAGGVFNSDPICTTSCQSMWSCNNATKQCYADTKGKYGYNDCPKHCSGGALKYSCDTKTLQCKEDPQGSFGSLTSCQDSCKARYNCNQTSLQCYTAASGQYTKEKCAENCVQKYTCNETSFQCVKDDAGYIPSLSDCQSQCYPKFTCAVETQTCVPSTSGQRQSQCKDNCKPTNSTPYETRGLWRGVQQNLVAVGEWDVQFTETTIQILSPTMEQLKGTVSLIDRTMFVQVTTGITGIPTGSVLSGLFSLDGQGPETSYLLLCFGEPNKKAPSSFEAALASATGWYWTFDKCVGDSCKFHWGKTSEEQDLVNVKMVIQDSDPCSNFANCSDCIAAASGNCGWCSEHVKYVNGGTVTEGKNCAAYAGPGAKSFQCGSGTATWRTADCFDYVCDHQQARCNPVGLGTLGAKSKYECEKECKSADPTPPPAQETYLCDLTTKQCKLDPAGTYSKAGCAEVCQATPTPPGLQGLWRGIEIDNQYPFGEFDIDFKGSDGNFALTFNGKAFSSGTVSFFGPTTAGSGSFAMKVTTGDSPGSYHCKYQIVGGRDGRHLTLVRGGSASDVPSGFDSPWMLGKPSGTEWSFFKAGYGATSPKH